MSTKNNKYLKRSDSRTQIRFYTPNKDVATVYPDFSMEQVIQAVNSDPVARGAINHFVDKCMEGEYNVVKKDSLTYDRDFELLLDEKYGFRTKVLRPIFLMGKLFNNVYVEVVRATDGKTKQLNVLDTVNIDAITEPNGDLIKIKGKTPYMDGPRRGQYPEWDKKDVVWIKFGDRQVGYAPVDIRALWENLLIKDYIRRFVAWLWKTGQYRVIYNFKSGARAQAIEDFLSMLRRNDDNFKTPFPIQGDLEMMMARDMKETESLTELLKYLDNQTLILLRVQPVDAGVPDASGRSNADAQSNSFATHIVSWKKVVEDAINFDLFPKINKSNNLLRFAPYDRFAEKQVFENIQIMKSLGMSNDSIQEYLSDRGMFFKARLFDPLPELGDDTIDNPRDKDTMPSRTGKGVGEANKNQDEITTRSDQMRKE